MKTHWKKLHNPDYLGAYSFDGADIIGTIQTVTREAVNGADGKKEDCTVIRFVEDLKPFILNVTNSKTIAKIYKTPFIEDWQGKQIQLFQTTVRAFGEEMEAVRIRPYIPEAPKCAECKKAIDGVGGKSNIQIAKYTATKYGRQLCSECATKESEK